MTQTTPNSPSSSLSFDDEFDQFVASPDGSQGWMTTYPYGGESARTLPGNKEAEYYSDSSVGANPFSVSGGVLNIEATPAAAGSNPYGLPYDSGLITTYKSFSQLYGYFEVRAELPAGTGLWPAFWLLPASNLYTSELDVFEVLGQDPTTLYATSHGSNNGVWSSVSQALKIADASTGFHTYGVDWEPTTITFYMDGKAIASAPTPASMNTPMYMLLNLAVGGAGSWPGSPNGSTVFPADMKIDYVRAYATAATRDISGGDAIATATPLTSIPTQPVPLTVGSGPDLLVLKISEDGWEGDAQYTVSVDGQQIGGQLTATALHDAGQDQTVSLAGNWGSGVHLVSVDFLNDAYGGAPTMDRNLYVDSASYDGAVANPGTLALMSSGTQSLIVGTDPPGGSIVTLGSGMDLLALKISEDAWQGNALFTIAVDGTQIGGVQTATALHDVGQDQTYDIAGSWGGGPHQVTVDFLNDAYGGSPAEDRNLYVDAASYDGAPTLATLALMSGGAQSLTVDAPDTLTLAMSEDAWEGDAEFTVSVDGKQAGGMQTVTALHGSGQTESFSVGGDWGLGQHTVSVDFLNDAYDGTPETDRNLYVDAITYDGNTVAENLPLYSAGTKSVSVVSATTYTTGTAGGTVTSVGDDTIIAGTGAVEIVASGPVATISLGSGDATISALAGRDTITGSTGGLRFIAGKAAATVALGSGAAVFDFTEGAGGGNIMISNFVPGLDSLHLVGYQGTGIKSELVSGGSTYIELTDDSRITLTGLTNSQHIFA